MLNLPEFNLPFDENRNRQKMHNTAAHNLKESCKGIRFSKLISFDFTAEIPEEIVLASSPQCAYRTLESVNTVEKNGCIDLISKMILNHYGINISVEELLSEIETKGYLDDEPLGIVGSIFLIDNIISIICKNKIRVYKDTRIHTIDQLVWNLRNGIFVPIRVENSIYHDDPSRRDGHYVILTGFNNGNAIIIDSSMTETNGINVIPADILFKSMLFNEKFICAWDLYPCELALFSEKKNS